MFISNKHTKSSENVLTYVVKMHIIKTWPTGSLNKKIRIGIKGEIILKERNNADTLIALCVCIFQLQACLCLKDLVRDYETGEMGSRWNRVYRQ